MTVTNRDSDTPLAPACLCHDYVPLLNPSPTRTVGPRFHHDHSESADSTEPATATVNFSPGVLSAVQPRPTRSLHRCRTIAADTVLNDSSRFRGFQFVLPIYDDIIIIVAKLPLKSVSLRRRCHCRRGPLEGIFFSWLSEQQFSVKSQLFFNGIIFGVVKPRGNSPALRELISHHSTC